MQNVWSEAPWNIQDFYNCFSSFWCDCGAWGDTCWGKLALRAGGRRQGRESTSYLIRHALFAVHVANEWFCVPRCLISISSYPMTLINVFEHCSCHLLSPPGQPGTTEILENKWWPSIQPLKWTWFMSNAFVCAVHEEKSINKDIWWAKLVQFPRKYADGV